MTTRWLRRLFGIDDKRGTLTFLTDGRVVVGVPVDTAPNVVHHVQDQVHDWLARSDRQGPVMFPWPVDVSDLR